MLKNNKNDFSSSKLFNRNRSTNNDILRAGILAYHNKSENICSHKNSAAGVQKVPCKHAQIAYNPRRLYFARIEVIQARERENARKYRPTMNAHAIEGISAFHKNSAAF